MADGEQKEEAKKEDISAVPVPEKVGVSGAALRVAGWRRAGGPKLCSLVICRFKSAAAQCTM